MSAHIKSLPPMQRGHICPLCGGRQRSGRSLPQHRYFFALVKLAFLNWPEDHEFQPSDQDHLRYWLVCKAGWHDVLTIEIESEDTKAAEAAADLARTSIRACGGMAFVRSLPGAITIFTPKSVAFARMAKHDFTRLFEKVRCVITKELGVIPELEDIEGAEV